MLANTKPQRCQVLHNAPVSHNSRSMEWPYLHSSCIIPSLQQFLRGNVMDVTLFRVRLVKPESVYKQKNGRGGIFQSLSAVY